MTKAQIELLMIDCPKVVYKAEKQPKPGEPGFTMTADKAQKEYERWLRRVEEEKKRGIKVDINDYLHGDVKVSNHKADAQSV